jgi:hypothetical protein
MIEVDQETSIKVLEHFDAMLVLLGITPLSELYKGMTDILQDAKAKATLEQTLQKNTASALKTVMDVYAKEVAAAKADPMAYVHKVKEATGYDPTAS